MSLASGGTSLMVRSSSMDITTSPYQRCLGGTHRGWWLVTSINVSNPALWDECERWLSNLTTTAAADLRLVIEASSESQRASGAPAPTVGAGVMSSSRYRSRSGNCSVSGSACGTPGRWCSGDVGGRLYGRAMTSVIEPFRVAFSSSELDDLRQRLAATRWPDELPGVGWDYGVALDPLRDLVSYWADGFDWDEQQRRLNEIPQFVTAVDGQRVHFLHARSAAPDAVPLLLLHGWPSTVADFLPLLPFLTAPETAGPAFHVVAPSLPGFGFSGPSGERGWDAMRIARAIARLMRRLGYTRYLVQGGDFGSLIGPEIGRVDTDHVIGVHANALVTLSVVDWGGPDPLAGLSEGEKGIVATAAAMWQQRSGYATIQATRPQTLAYALNDSPSGLLAWDLEWFVDYDPTTSALTPIDRDAILTDVTITWLTRTAGSSARLYKEAGAAFAARPNSGVPTAVANFPGDTAVRTLAERSHTIVRWTDYERGGHFAALQAPDLLATDVRAFAESIA